MINTDVRGLPVIWLLKEALLVMAASAILALSAQISFPIPFSPVPVSLQTMALLLIGAALGPSRGALAVALYLSEGALGLPVFTFAQSGFHQLLGPKAGYFFGFFAVVVTSGYLMQRAKGALQVGLSFLIASSSIYLLGLPWLSFWVGSEAAIQLGLYPFVIGDLLKVLSATALVTGLKKFSLDSI